MNRIKELREGRGWTLSELGEKLRVDKATVSRYENEKLQFYPATINMLCDIFGCTSDYLLCRSDVPYSSVSEEDAKHLAVYHALPLEIRRAVDGLMAPYMNAAEEKKVV